MATYDATKGGGVVEGLGWSAFKGASVISIELDFAAIIAADAALTTQTNIATSDVLKILNWPARLLPVIVATEVVTPTTAAATADLGLAGGQEGEAAIDLDATAGSIVTQSIADTALDALFAGGDTLDLEILTAAVTDGKLRIHILCFECYAGNR